MGCNGSAKRYLELEGVVVLAPAEMPSCEIARVLGTMADILGKCESPAEALFFAAVREEPFSLGVVPQHRVLNYRLDFAYPERKLAIEIDGHEWHKTAAQREADAKKDRRLMLQGWLVMRFTASEVRRDVGSCVRAVKIMLEKLAEKVWATE